MPRIIVLATGGTISSRSSRTGAFVAADTADELVARVREEVPEVAIEAVDIVRKNSFNLTLGDLRAIVQAIALHLRRPDVDGIVVTHGTDTMEETAFLADLVHADERPVVFTGSQLSPQVPQSDGPGNLRDAIRVAAAPCSRGNGALVSFAGEIYAARGLRKSHSVAAAPFSSAVGAIGWVRGRQVSYRARPLRSTVLDVPSEAFGEVRVDAIMSYPGADPALLRAAAGSGARGIVVVGTGAGNLNEQFIPDIRDLTTGGVVVALASRVDDGPIVPIYGGGGAVDAIDAGAVPIGELPVSQARILLAALLDRHSPDEVRRCLLRLNSADLLPEPPRVRSLSGPEAESAALSAN